MAERVKSWGAWAAFAVSVVTLGTLLIAWGEVKRQITVDKERIDKLEDRGSPALEAFTEVQKLRNAETDRRITIIEAAVVALTKSEAKFDLINLKLENIEKGLGRVEKQMIDHITGDAKKGP